LLFLFSAFDENVDSGHIGKNRLTQWMKAPKHFIQISYHNFHEHQWPSTMKYMRQIRQQLKHHLVEEKMPPSVGGYERVPPSEGGYERVPPYLSGKLV